MPRGASATPTGATPSADEGPAHDVRNEVRLCGRLSAPAEERTLPSGDVIVTLRIVIPRPEPTRRSGSPDGGSRPGQVDTIDVVCWSAGTRRAALRLDAGATIEIAGALRRRFFATPSGRQSRYEVEARTVRRPGRRRVSGT
ncbi:MAG TPA: single-stranded DNA-binding protein [Intrasporangium sp.]|uniref:single-stranded DNA-binding protein n=1 Tax=Intrasporangium sp. TaxID=1925024 RepID=UPI002B46721A|nr:single-stranded DNA-binding protein [Intrasporangium sp.]HKX68865.1 single-stranded DNA-binding protein [Intrasporangium sp.]